MPLLQLFGAWPGQGRLIAVCQRSQPPQLIEFVCLLCELRTRLQHATVQQCNSATDAAVAAAKWVKYDSVLGAIYARRVYSFTILLVANKKKANKQSGQANKKREGGTEMRQADRTNNLQQPQVDLPRFASCDQGRVEFRGLSKINFKLKWKRKWSQVPKPASPCAFCFRSSSIFLLLPLPLPLPLPPCLS